MGAEGGQRSQEFVRELDSESEFGISRAGWFEADDSKPATYESAARRVQSSLSFGPSLSRRGASELAYTEKLVRAARLSPDRVPGESRIFLSIILSFNARPLVDGPLSRFDREPAKMESEACAGREAAANSLDKRF